jgi:hypothetical protein
MCYFGKAQAFPKNHLIRTALQADQCHFPVGHIGAVWCAEVVARVVLPWTIPRHIAKLET